MLQWHNSDRGELEFMQILSQIIQNRRALHAEVYE